MDTNDHAYFLRRADEERERASVAEDNTAALVHSKLADEYAKRANSIDVISGAAGSGLT